MSGYDKSPDYGGPPPTWRSYVITTVFVGVGAAGMLFLLLKHWPS